MSFVNIAKNSKVTFSSMSKWSTDEDFREIVTAEHDRDYSFHTNLEHNPWVELDLGAIYVLHNIVVFNIKNKDYQDRANNLQVAISTDKVNYEIIHKGFIPFKEKIEFNLDSLKTARYVKLSIDDFNYFHLSKIEVFIDESKNSGLIFDYPLIPDEIKFNTFYIGSCRYMQLFPKHFPARLHTTKEIINFLNNYNKIDLKMVDANYIFGDLVHPICKNDSIAYCNNMDHIFDSVTTIFLEISSRKYILNNGVVYNNYYFNFYNSNNDKKISIISDEELFSDLLHIKYLLKNKFGIESIVVIPHINLLLENGEKIAGRNNLVSSLKKICKILNIEFLDINKAFPEGTYFKDIAPDSKHYSEKGNLLVSQYMNDYLNNFVLGISPTLDCTQYYDGTQSSTEFENFWGTLHDSNTVIVDNTGTTILTDASRYSETYMQIPPVNFNQYTNVPLCYEFDILESTNYSVCAPIRLNNGDMLWWATPSDKTGHYKFEITPNFAALSLDGNELWNSGPISAVKSRLYLQSNHNMGNGLIKFKNLKIYPI